MLDERFPVRLRQLAATKNPLSIVQHAWISEEGLRADRPPKGATVS